MAILTDDFLDTFTHYGGSSTLAATKWTSFIGTISAAPLGDTFVGEYLASITLATRTLAVASRVAGLGFKARDLFVASGTNPLGGVYTSTGHVRLQATQTGFLQLVINGSVVATDNFAMSTGVYYDVEMLVDQGGASGSAHQVLTEVRINGARRAPLTSTTFPPVSATALTIAQPIGSLSPPTITFATAFQYAQINVSPPTGVSPAFYYIWTKRGTGASPPWTSVTTAGGTHAVKTDFVGVRKRTWIYPNAEGFYAIAGSNWTAVVGVYPASVADSSTGMDSDSSYLENGVSGTAVVADRISHALTNLPGSATSIGMVQDVLAVRNQGAAADTVRPFRSVSSGTPTPVYDSNVTPGSGYAMTPMPLTQPPVGGTAVWDIATVNAMEVGLEQSTLA